MGQQYITKTNLSDRFGQIEIEDMANGDEAKISAVIASVSALVDGYVAPRYRLPLKNEYEILKSAACDIAFYKLQPIRPSETARKNYEDAVSLLKQISRGDVVLNEPTGEESKTINRFYVKKQPRRFTLNMWN